MSIYGKYITENCNNVLENFNTYINESENFDIITESLDLNKAKDFLIQGVKKIKEFIVKIGKSIVNFFKNFMSWIKTVGVKIKEKAKLLLDGLIKKEDFPKDFQDKIDKCVIKCYAYGDFYKENTFISVHKAESSMLSPIGLEGTNKMKIYVCGNDDRITVTSVFDNLGKGASGAAIQCMNLMIGADEDKGLNL